MADQQTATAAADKNHGDKHANAAVISGGRFFLVGFVGALVEAGIAELGLTILIVWAAIFFILSIIFVIKSRKAEEPNAYVYGTVFALSTVFTIFGIILAYVVIKSENLTT